MTTQDVEKRWFKALFEEDCLHVKELLNENRELLKVGWSSDNNRFVEGSPDKPWSGRTALHVGARRGDIDLVEKVLILCGGLQEHRNIECDGCAMSHISGSRFKSCEKPDFNLCLNCFEGPNGDEKEYAKIDFQGQTRRIKTYKKSAQRVNLIPDDASSGNLAPRVLQQSNRGDEEHPKTTTPIDTQDNKRKGEDVPSSSKDSLAFEGEQQTTGESASALQKYKARVNREPTGNRLVSKEELEAFLLSKDGQYELDALAMVTLQGNADIIDLLVCAIEGGCDPPPSYIVKKPLVQVSNGNDNAQRIELTKVMEEVINSLSEHDTTFMAACVEEYNKHQDFNFLAKEEYLFHFSCTSRFEDVFAEEDKKLFRRTFWDKVRCWPNTEKIDEHRNASEQENTQILGCFIFALHDGQGRTPFHVALDEGTYDVFINWYLEVHEDSHEKEKDILLCAMTAPDGSGKMPVHRAAATIQMKQYRKKFWKNLSNGISSVYPEATMGKYALDELSKSNGFRSGDHRSTPLHAAIIHNGTSSGSDWCWLRNPKEDPYPLPAGNRYTAIYLDEMELVCISRANIKWVKNLLEEGYLESKEKPSSISASSEFEANLPLDSASQWQEGSLDRSNANPSLDLALSPEEQTWGHIYKHWWPLLHFVATYGNYDTLKFFMAKSACDPYVEDTMKNTALHCVMGDALQLGPKEDGDLEFNTHLLDYMSCKHLLMKDRRKVKKSHDKQFWVDKQGSVNLLLQAGCDMFRTNKLKDVPYPQGTLFSSPKFLSWWYKMQSKEFGAIQNNLIYAANAISITATLVATASFVGPLQPPRGFNDGQLDYEMGSVAVFVFCNTLSFCLAIVAIILSLVPCLPMPQEAMFEELQRTRMMVTCAVSVLFPSIVSIVIAFASSSIAVVTPTITSALGRNLVISSLCIGGVLVIASFFFFSIRLLGLCFPGNSWTKKFNIFLVSTK